MQKISRRQFFKFITTAAGGALVACARLGTTSWRSALAEAIENKVFLPLVRNGEPAPEPTPLPTVVPPSLRPRVVHIHSSAATSWDESTTDYWNYVSQDVVNNMVDMGLMKLTGVSTVVDAWRVILPTYQVGQGIAIKVNFNNSNYTSCDDRDGQIDAVIEPVNAIIRGLLQIGVEEQDVWIYDAMRPIPVRFVAGCLYNNVKFFDTGCNDFAGFTTNFEDSQIAFYPPPGVPIPAIEKVTNVLVNASYLINLPIMKFHSSKNGVTLSFKNHFGSIHNPGGLHDYINSDNPIYLSDYSVLVDLYRNKNICEKTILTVGDGLFAADYYAAAPKLWKTFGNKPPNSIFLSKDPVALDCVLCDHLYAEYPTKFSETTDDYLVLASAAGFGAYERGDPWVNTYKLIDYQKIEYDV